MAASPAKGSAKLRACPRDVGPELARRFAALTAPRGVIWLSPTGGGAPRVPASDILGPVPFNHGTHADWMAKGEGCAVCHHHAPQGSEPTACRGCHEAGDSHRDMRRPGLKGAYHRQCMGCHREWSHETDCTVCHVRAKGGAPASATPDDALGTAHPVIATPAVKTHLTDYPDEGASQVTFDHSRHVTGYALRCVDCHRGDACGRCHDTAAAKKAGAEPTHDACSRCHDTDSGRCDNCHRPRGSAPNPAFDHATTGWPLRSYHEGLNCRQCHTQIPYRALGQACNSCREQRSGSTKDHGRFAGLALDANHLDLSCTDCHAGGKFDRPAQCEGCHDDKRSPAQKPGKIMK